nr:ribonuclease H-like domain-containing protein [Tanacetum cinerariifolium]
MGTPTQYCDYWSRWVRLPKFVCGHVLILVLQLVGPLEFGDSYKTPPEETAKDKGLAREVSSSTNKKGRTVAITAKDMQKRKNDVKARTTLLLALPDEHQLQAIVSHLEFMDVPIEQDDLNQKFLTSLAPEWLVYTIAWRNKDDLDTMSLDDVYNHLKVYEPEVQKRARSNSQNMAFIFSSNTSSGKSEVPTVHGASTASAQVPTVSTDVATMGHFARECRSPMSQDRGKRKSYEKDPKVEEPAPKAMISIDGIGWDWSYMAEEDEASKSHALVADEEEVPTEYALMAKSSSSSDNERDIELKDNKIEYLRNELEEVKKEKESIDFKIENFENASKDLDRLLGSQKLDKDMKDVEFNEYCVVSPPLAQVYSPPKKDLSWIGLPEFVDDTITDYTRPTPSIDVSKSVSKEQEKRWKSNHPSFFEQGGSSGNVVSKPMINFVKESGCPNAAKVNNTENARKPTMKYAEIYKNTSQSSRVRGNQRNWNNQKPQQPGKYFMMQNKACYNCSSFDHLEFNCNYDTWVDKGKT